MWALENERLNPVCHFMYKLLSNEGLRRGKIVRQVSHQRTEGTT